MSQFDLEKLAAWCLDALEFLRTPDLPGMDEGRRQTVERWRGKRKQMFEIASDLAEGLSDLPVKEREAAQRTLVDRYGFGYEFFVERKYKAVRKVLRKGHIGNDLDYRNLLDLAADTTLDDRLRCDLSTLLADYEARRAC